MRGSRFSSRSYMIVPKRRSFPVPPSRPPSRICGTTGLGLRSPMCAGPNSTPKPSPWIDIGDVRRRGIAVVFDKVLVDAAMLDQWREAFGAFEVGPPMVLPRQTWHPVKPTQVFYGYIAPRP